MTQPLHWSSIPTPTPPILLAAAPTSPTLAWAGHDGDLFWQSSPANDPISVARMSGTPTALTLSATGDHIAWLTNGGILPDAVRAVLSAVLRILPCEVVASRWHGHAASVTGFGGYGEIARKGNLDNLLPTEHAYPRQLLWGRLLQGEALYYGRESAPPSLHESTWLVIDGSAAMAGDPLLLARAIGVAAARLAGRNVEFRFFDTNLGPSQRIERPGDVWQLIHGPPRLPSNGDSTADPWAGSAAVWQGLLRSLQGRSEGDARVHLVVVSHEFLGAEEADVVVNGLGEISEFVDFRLVLIQFPDIRPYFERNPPKGFEPWMTRGPSLVPERPPWKILQERGVPVALVPVTRLWEVDD